MDPEVVGEVGLEVASVATFLTSEWTIDELGTSGTQRFFALSLPLRTCSHNLNRNGFRQGFVNRNGNGFRFFHQYGGVNLRSGGTF